MKAIEQRRRMAGQGGFTLIELLVVIAILAVLAGVVVFAVGGINNSSKNSACKIDARTVKTAVQAYMAQNGSYPADQAALVPGLLEKASTNVDFAVSGSPQTVTYSWQGTDCTAATTGQATP